MKTLPISEELSLPLDAATQTFAVIARKGAGKSYASGKLVELLMDAGVQCVILDTVGNWYGLRLAANGKDTGFDIPVLGGLRGDIPLESTGGELVADLIIDTGRSVIIDLSQFSLADRKRFAAAFGTRLWQKKKAQHEPSALHLVVEESQLIIPQVVRGDDARMVGIFEEIIRLGRNYGIGVCMITQRPQSVNKDVLTQTECLIVLQVNGAQERKALKEWIVHQGMDTRLVDELPSLPVGTAYVWSPQWLRILKKVKIAPKRTFDSTSTPKVGSISTSSAKRDLAPLDLAAFREKMAATIQRAKDNDPAELRRTIADLRRQLAKPQPQAAPIQKPVEVLTDADRTLLAAIKNGVEQFDKGLRELLDRAQSIGSTFQLLRGIFEKRPGLTHSAPARVIHPAPVPRPVHRPVHNGDTGTISGGLRRMMIALAQRPGLTKRQLGVRAGLSSKSGTFGTYLGKLRSSGWIHGADQLQLTEQGFGALGHFDPLPEGQELLNYWYGELGTSGAGRMLRALAEVYPRALTKSELGQMASISADSGTFGTYLGKLRSLELVEGRGELTASKELFE